MSSLRTLAALTSVALVVTQPDRPKGRSGRPTASPVKEAALELGLPVAQPAARRGLLEALASVAPFDVGLVVAYGMILRPEVLDIPRRGFLNLHYSLLPRWRGAAPVERAILSGDDETGVTLMRLDEGLDTGPVVGVEPVAISTDEDAGLLLGRLNELGVRLLQRCLLDYVSGRILLVPQNPEGATYAEKISPQEAQLDLSLAAAEVLSRIRAFSPRPGAFALLNGERFKIWQARPLPEISLEPGRLEVVAGTLAAGVGDGTIALDVIQAAGGRRMNGADWARGRRGDLGVLE